MKEIPQNDIKNPLVQKMIEEQKKKEKNGYYVRIDSNTIVCVRRKRDIPGIKEKFQKLRKKKFNGVY